MNSIAAQIDYATDIFKATNDLLEARAAHRKAQESGNVLKVIDAQVKVLQAEIALENLYPVVDAPVADVVDTDPLPDCGETKDEHPDYYSRTRNIDHILDDPRMGQK